MFWTLVSRQAYLWTEIFPPRKLLILTCEFVVNIRDLDHLNTHHTHKFQMIHLKEDQTVLFWSVLHLICDSCFSDQQSSAWLFWFFHFILAHCHLYLWSRMLLWHLYRWGRYPLRLFWKSWAFQTWNMDRSDGSTSKLQKTMPFPSHYKTAW